MTSLVVSAVYELPRPIWIDNDVLGGRFETRIGPVRATLVTPNLNTETGGVGPPALTGLPDGALGRIVGEHPTRIDAYDRFASVLDPEWCTEYAANHPPGSTALRVVGFELTEDSTRSLDGLTSFTLPSDRIHDAASRCVEEWYVRIAEWISILTGQDLDHRHQIYDAEPVGSGFRSWGNGAWRSTSVKYSFPEVTPVTRDQWSAVLGHVGEGKRPPLEWQLLLAGASALDRGYFRRAVTEFATAIEICLTRLVENSASSANRPKKTATLPKWSEWLVAHEPGYTVDEGFDDLVTLRNDVIHRGPEPTYDSARAAYECARRIVSTYGRARDGSDG